MTRQVIVRSQTVQQRRRRAGEMAGGAAADCAAVCCCCPCAVLNFVVLAVYTVPTGLFRKAVHKRKRQRLLKDSKNKKNDVVLLQHQQQRPSSAADNAVGPTLEEHLANEDEGAAEKSEAVALEKEMWARFAGTGFWRSQSQNEP